MCRIAGVINFRKELSDADWQALQSCSKILEKGGPDAAGFKRNEKAAFLHRRLSIIDTSTAANQPFVSQDGRFQFIYNGEIFNYKALYEKYLLPKGVMLKTSSDTEVLFELLKNYGSTCLQWLSGFFAFCFYDVQSHTALLARDRFGKKPMVVYQNDDKIIFASEMKAILAFDFDKIISPTAVQLYFRLNYLPPHLSILKQVYKLKPGHYIQLQASGVEEKAYYKTEKHPAEYKEHTYQQAKDMLIEKMAASVQERMIADVPLGAFLSGGIDSSVVVALAAQCTKHLNTFSIGYKNNPIFDETKYAKLVANKYQTNHEVFYLDEDDFKNEVFHLLDYLDEPFADSSAIPQYILCKQTRKKVTVALSGDGGDEVFAGYNKHKAEWLFRNNTLLTTFAKSTAPVWEKLPKSRNSALGNKIRQLNKFAKGAKLDMKERYFQWCSILAADEAMPLFAAAFARQINMQDAETIREQYSQHIQSNDFNEFLLADLNLVLPGDMLQKVDMMSMANSLEVRSPFLDFKVVDFAFSLPAEYKINKQLKKRIVQDAFRDMLPEEIYNRPKQGFEIPLLDWFRKDLYSYIFDDLLNEEFINQQGIFDFAQIEKLRDKLLSNNPEYVQATIWALVVFQHWYKKYFSK